MPAVAGAEPGIDAATLYERIGFAPHSSGQHEYLHSTARFNAACCGRRYGKSQAAGHRMTFKSFVPDSWNWIIGTSYRIGEKEFRVVWDDYNKLGLLRHCKKAYSQHQGDMYITTPWNSHIMVVSADNPDSLVGEALSHVIMSEAAKHNRATWEQYVEPGLSDLRGSADFPSTPQGFNWYHGMYMLGQASAIAPANPVLNKLNVTRQSFAKDYKSWQSPTWENSIRFPGGRNDPEILRVEANVSPVWFAQEYGAKFTAMAGSIYEEWDEERHVIQDYEFNAYLPNILAFDYGFANPFVCLDIQIMPDDTVIVWREYNKSGLSNQTHATNLKEREQPQGYRVDAMWGDHRDPDAAVTLSENLGYGTVGSMDVPWKLSVEHIKRMLAADPTKLKVHASCTNLIRQMNNLHIKEQSRQAKFDLQETAGDQNMQHKVDDHAADALRYFIGPHYVAGGGVRLEDIMGENYQGSESESFVLNKLSEHMILDEQFGVRL